MIDIYSGSFALFAFAVAVGIGLIRGSPLANVLAAALAAMLVFLFVGKALGHIGRKVVEEDFEKQRAAEKEGADKSAADGKKQV
jgi:divalent metal cation (Fe/Co/Zn/Cd) transporter